MSLLYKARLIIAMLEVMMLETVPALEWNVISVH
jgi:hypothetical protein